MLLLQNLVGMTTTESLASKLPMIIINPIPGQEEENAEFLEKNGVCVWIKKDDDITKVLNDLFSNPEKLNNMKINSALLGNRYSTHDICSTLLKSLEESC